MAAAADVAGVSRRCGMCHHQRRSNLERRILDGESIRIVAADAGYSESAVYRHLRNHIAPELAAELGSRGHSLHVRDFGARLIALLEETAAVREFAKLSNDGRLLLQATAQERDTLGVLLTRLGIDNQDVLDTLDEAHALVRACISALGSHPQALAAVAGELRDQGEHELAHTITHIASGSRPAPVLAIRQENQP